MLLESQGYEVVTADQRTRRVGVVRVPSGLRRRARLRHAGDEWLDEVAAALKRLDPAVKILLYSAYVDLSEEVLRWVDAYAIKGDHPKTLVAAVQQLLACPEVPSQVDSCRIPVGLSPKVVCGNPE